MTATELGEGDGITHGRCHQSARSLEATPCAESRNGVASGDSLLVTMTASESDALAHARQPDLLAVTHGGTLRVRSRILQEAFSLFFIKEEISLILWP